MVQEFHPEAAEGIYSLSGFVDEAGELFEVRGAMKVLQRPRRLGVGVCFESAPVRPDLVAGLTRLCKKLGYHGVFEVEFIQTKDGVPPHRLQPALLRADGLRHRAGAAAAAARVPRGHRGPGRAHARGGGRARRQRRRTRTRCSATASRWRCCSTSSGCPARSPGDEARQWRQWFNTHKETAVDPLIDRDDMMPAAVELATISYGSARHPRAFLRMMVFNR